MRFDLLNLAYSAFVSIPRGLITGLLARCRLQKPSTHPNWQRTPRSARLRNTLTDAGPLTAVGIAGRNARLVRIVAGLDPERQACGREMNPQGREVAAKLPQSARVDPVCVALLHARRTPSRDAFRLSERGGAGINLAEKDGDRATRRPFGAAAYDGFAHEVGGLTAAFG